eukprot:TRINITY_DN7990_c1_g1_i1.p1 TRINITY_DN7990_c1_g1~~TRINITY_DN7990_c1_g1_i1.p1  ORF type:complete len:308 (+),score=35.15 TRINITY_DN7990_c1_g1_i1:36-926(+)
MNSHAIEIPEAYLKSGFSGMRNVPVQYFRKIQLIVNGGKVALIAVITGGQLLLAKENGNIKYCVSVSEIKAIDIYETEEMVIVNTVSGCFQIKFQSDLHVDEFSLAIQQLRGSYGAHIAIHKKSSFEAKELPKAVKKKKVEILPLTVPLPAYRIPFNRSESSQSSVLDAQSPRRHTEPPKEAPIRRVSEQPPLQAAPQYRHSSVFGSNRNMTPSTVEIEIPTSNHTSRVLHVPTHCANSVRYLVSDMISAHNLLDTLSGSGNQYGSPSVPDPVGDRHVPSPVRQPDGFEPELRTFG